MLDVKRMCHDVLSAAEEISQSYGHHMSQDDFCKIAINISSQVTKAIIQEHQMVSLENDHPAIKDLREKLTMMTKLLQTKETQ
jgi:hypothetical protein